MPHSYCLVLGKPELIAQLPDDEDTACSFFIEWRTHVSTLPLPVLIHRSFLPPQFACPHGERGFWSTVLVIIFSACLVLAMLYIVCMTLYNRYARHLRGFDQIPAPPRQLTRAFSAFGKFLSFLSKKLGLGENDGAGVGGRRGLNPNSHHWSDAALGVGGSRFGSGARLEEEEAMLGGGEYEEDEMLGDGDDLGDVGAAGAGRHVNPWHGSLAAGAGVAGDPAGTIRL
jgi:cation-dependent mannose-6-phosphate receptor